MTLFCGIQFSVLQFKLYFCSARTRECAYFCMFLNQICTSQSTCPRQDELALYSPPRCYLVNLNYWLPRSGSSFPSKQKSHIKEMNWPNLFKSLSNISLCVYAKWFHAYYFNPLRHYSFASVHFCYKPLLTIDKGYPPLYSLLFFFAFSGLVIRV